MRKRERIWEGAKTMIVLVLMVMLVTLCVIYMLSYQNTARFSFTAEDMRTLSGQSVKYQYNDYLDASYAAPKFIGASASLYGEKIGFYTLGGENDKVARSIIAFYEVLFSEETGDVEFVPPAQGKALFDAALAGDHIYIAYENDIPRSLLYTMTAENALATASTHEVICEIIIAPEEFLYRGISSVPFGSRILTDNYSFFAIARDSNGNYYRYSTEYRAEDEEDICFNTNFYLSYTGIETKVSYQLAGELYDDPYFSSCGIEDAVTDTTVIVGENSAPVGNRLAVSAANPDTAAARELLSALLINPDQVTTYTDASGIRYFYDGGETVSITPGGLFEYTAYGEEGLALSGLFDYHAANESYDVRDYVGASLMLARSLESIINKNGTAKLYLSGVVSDGEAIHITFGYAAHGLPVYIGGGSEILTLTFEKGSLRFLSYDLLRIADADPTGEQINMLWVMRSLVPEAVGLREYAFGYASSGSRVYESMLIRKEP